MAPLQIDNVGLEPAIVAAKADDGEEFGYNAKTGEFGDLFEMGVIDPVKVTPTPSRMPAPSPASC